MCVIARCNLYLLSIPSGSSRILLASSSSTQTFRKASDTSALLNNMRWVGHYDPQADYFHDEFGERFCTRALTHAVRVGVCEQLSFLLSCTLKDKSLIKRTL